MRHVYWVGEERVGQIPSPYGVGGETSYTVPLPVTTWGRPGNNCSVFCFYNFVLSRKEAQAFQRCPPSSLTKPQKAMQGQYREHEGHRTGDDHTACPLHQNILRSWPTETGHKFSTMLTKSEAARLFRGFHQQGLS